MQDLKNVVNIPQIVGKNTIISCRNSLRIMNDRVRFYRIWRCVVWCIFFLKNVYKY